MVKKFEWYKADDEKTHFKRRKPKPTKLKHGIVPGQVLVLLVGQFKGKRVVFLKQLESGMLLVTGPFKVNGVPLRRIPQKYTLATSKRLSIDGVNVDKVTDAFFRKVRGGKGTKEQQFFEKDKKEGQDSAAQQKVGHYFYYYNVSLSTFSVCSFRLLIYPFSIEEGNRPREKRLTKGS